MVLPDTVASWLFLLGFAVLALGTWILTLPKRLRFELYYFDFAISVLLGSVIAAYTLGSLGFDGFLFEDDLAQAGRRPIAYAVAAGVILNLGNMLFVAATRLLGISVSALLFFGTATGIAAATSLITSTPAESWLMAVVAFSLTCGVLAYLVARKLTEQASQPPSQRKSLLIKGSSLALAAATFVVCSYPLIQWARVPNIGLGPYSIGFLMATGIFLSTIVYNLFFMTFPVQGKPLELSAYLKTARLNHLYGIIGAVLWFGGLLALLVATHTARNFRYPEVLPAVTIPACGIVLVLGGLLKEPEFKPRQFTTLAMLLAACATLGLAVAIWVSRIA